MEHVVFFPSSDGTPAFRRLPSFEEAVRLVEHLRNVEGVEQVTVHSLTEVPLAFRAYYRVEVPGAPQASAPVPPVEIVPVDTPAAEVASVGVPNVEPAAQTVVPLEPEAQPAPALALVEDLPVQAGGPETAAASSNGHGARSLGFFA